MSGRESDKVVRRLNFAHSMRHDTSHPTTITSSPSHPPQSLFLSLNPSISLRRSSITTVPAAICSRLPVPRVPFTFSVPSSERDRRTGVVSSSRRCRTGTFTLGVKPKTTALGLLYRSTLHQHSLTARRQPICSPAQKLKFPHSASRCSDHTRRRYFLLCSSPKAGRTSFLLSPSFSYAHIHPKRDAASHTTAHAGVLDGHKGPRRLQEPQLTTALLRIATARSCSRRLENIPQRHADVAVPRTAQRDGQVPPALVGSPKGRFE